jgi:hypothetical protein
MRKRRRFVIMKADREDEKRVGWWMGLRPSAR